MQGKVVVIVGATGGIGSALSHKLALSGAKLFLAGRSSHKLEALATALIATTTNITENITEIRYCAADITDPQQSEALMQAALQHFGRIDVVVNVAGAGIMKQFNKLEPADLDAMIDLNLKGNFYVLQAAANAMKDQRSGHLCNVIGILGKHSMSMAAAYCGSKFGAVGMTKCVAEEVRRWGIRTTIFYFGGIDTPFWDQVSLKVDRTKMLRPETAADAILFAMQAEPNAVPLEINIQPDSHVFF
ncbi:MAG: SDR family oxidoreductase [Pseudanabaena sp. ELA607]|jgi:NAD(P)-dependent dehydrogenase (short-subunit alcohol dehydrogenase family)